MQHPDVRLGGLLLLWVAAVGTGFALLSGYGAADGTPATAPAVWPDAPPLARAPDAPTLVLFAHPRCPCTRASLAELARAMRYAHGGVRAYALFLQPEGKGDGFADTDLWHRAAAIPGVEPVRDVGGTLSHQFGAYTSGQVLLYDAGGRLRFAGGITPARGHEGSNAGRAALIDLLSGGPNTGASAAAEAAVFGCPLHDADAACSNGVCDPRERP